MKKAEVEQIKNRLSHLEEAVFGMTHEEAEATVDSYVEAIKDNPDIKATPAILKAEKMLGV